MILDDLYYDYGKDTVYCYSDVPVLKNKLRIRNGEILNKIERELTFLKGTELDEHPLEGKLDFDYLKKIHRFLFGDIYDWAGEIRKVDISKGNVFCLHEYIEANARALFDELKNENYLDINFEDLPERIAYYFGEVNTLHPFREGNGRTQRIFFREMASRLGYDLDFNDVSRTEMIKASNAAFHRDYKQLEKLVARSLKPKER